MRVTASDKSRLKKLIALIRPADSLAARVERLSGEHRAIYDRYSERMREWIERNDLDDDGERGNAWAMILRGYGPPLPATITTALHGEMPQILKTDTDDNAARKYMDSANA